MANSTKLLKKLGEVLKNHPKGSAKYKKAMKDLDAILGIPEEPEREASHEDYNYKDSEDSI